MKLNPEHMPYDGDLLITIACPVGCDFCVYSCLPQGESMPESTMRRVAEQYSKNDFGIRICGGEPFLNPQNLARCMDILSEYYTPSQLLIITSAFFAVSDEAAERNLKLLTDRKWDTILVSYDIFHHKTVPLRNIECVTRTAKRLGLRIILRLTLDDMTDEIVNELARIVVTYSAEIETHGYGSFGRAEKLPKSTGHDMVKKKLSAKLKELGRDIESCEGFSPKRSQLDYAATCFPCTYPNGNVYGCSICAKGCYLGNINREDLSDMVARFKGTLQGYVLVSSNSNYSRLSDYLPAGSEDHCEFCRNYPFTVSGPFDPEFIGRRYIKVTLDNLDSVAKLYDDRHELLLSLDLTPAQLNKETGARLAEFFRDLQTKHVRFVLSKPLPPCLLNISDASFIRSLKAPKSCYDCKELFFTKDGNFYFCNKLNNAAGPKLADAKNRQEVFVKFKEMHDKLSVVSPCKECIYFKRSQCNGLCFGRF